MAGIHLVVVLILTFNPRQVTILASARISQRLNLAASRVWWRCFANSTATRRLLWSAMAWRIWRAVRLPMRSLASAEMLCARVWRSRAAGSSLASMSSSMSSVCRMVRSSGGRTVSRTSRLASVRLLGDSALTTSPLRFNSNQFKPIQFNFIAVNHVSLLLFFSFLYFISDYDYKSFLLWIMWDFFFFYSC